MRTDKDVAKVLLQSDWEKLVKKHYSERNQTKRIKETVKFVTDYCVSKKENGQAVFSGIWKYLDVIDEKHVDKFLDGLTTSLEIALNRRGKILLLVNENEEGEELKVLWN